jgi:hypothetical protein
MKGRVRPVNRASMARLASKFGGHIRAADHMGGDALCRDQVIGVKTAFHHLSRRRAPRCRPRSGSGFRGVAEGDVQALASILS